MRILAIDPGPEQSALLEYDTETRQPVWWVKEPNEAMLSRLGAAPVWWVKEPNEAMLSRLGAAPWVKEPNEAMLSRLGAAPYDLLAVEMVASYGMAVGATVFETCVWAGRFIERWLTPAYGRPEPVRVFRREVKLHLCGSARAKDANIRQALIDRYGPGKDLAIGRKASPGPLYGLTGDCWSALAVAVTVADENSRAVAA